MFTATTLNEMCPVQLSLYATEVSSPVLKYTRSLRWRY